MTQLANRTLCNDKTDKTPSFLPDLIRSAWPKN